MGILSLLVATCFLQQPAYHPHGKDIVVTMMKGETFVIRTDPAASPKTVAYILKLTRKGFYNRQRIHRVEDWVIQWGAPASKNKPLYVTDKKGVKDINPLIGDGGSGEALPFEESRIDFLRGVVGIASDGLQMGGDSQLFVLKGNREYLYRSYAIVGKVVKGMNVVDRIKIGDRISSMRVVEVPQLSK